MELFRDHIFIEEGENIEQILDKIDTEEVKRLDLKIDANGDRDDLRGFEHTNHITLIFNFLDFPHLPEFPDSVQSITFVGESLDDQEIFSSLKHLRNLTELGFEETGDLQKFNGLSQINHLKTIRFSKCWLKYIPEELFSLQLTGLSFYQVPMSLIDPQITQFNLEELTISGVSFKDNFEYFKALDLVKSKNDNYIPEWISGMKSLKKLRLSFLGIDKIPNWIFEMNLQELSLPFNKISDISNIGSMALLKTLDLMDNQISDISPIGSLSNLISLSISKNQVKSLTPLFNLRELESLYTSSNQIESIEPIYNLKKIQSLAVSGNPIKEINFSRLPIERMNYLSIPLSHLDENQRDEWFQILRNPSENVNIIKGFKYRLEGDIQKILDERRCCRLHGRLGDRYCNICGKAIPKEYMI